MLKHTTFGTLCMLTLLACQPMNTGFSSQDSNAINSEQNTTAKPRKLLSPQARSSVNDLAGQANIENGLRLISSNTDELGFRHMKYQAVFQGVPIWAAISIIHINKAGEIYRVDGDIPDVNPALNTHPSISDRTAIEAALSKLNDSAWSSVASELSILTDSGESTLVWQVECLNAVQRRLLFVDANTAKVVKTIALSNT